MVRQQKKKGQGVEALAEMEAETDKQVKNYDKIRKACFDDEMNTGYFFSVVFDTKAERDKWLKERSLTLVEDFFIKAKDFKI